MPESLAQQADTPPIQPGHAACHTVLYIDSDSANVAAMRELLGHHGMELIMAPSAESGIQLAQSRRPDLILLELGRSGTSGVEVTTVLPLAKETYRIPILALSSGACCNVPGLSMYCRRPINVPAFLAMLRALLEAPQSATRRAPPARRKRPASSPRQLDAMPRS